MAKKRNKARRTLALINVVTFATVLMLGGVLFCILPKQQVSEFEKRRLSPVPQFSWNELWYGKYIDSLELYVSDNFPMREQLVELSFRMKESRGIKNRQITFYAATDIRKPKKKVEHKKIDVKDSAKQDSVIIEGEGEEVNNLFIFEGAAMEIFGGNNYMAQSYAAAINKYEQELRGSVHVYALMIPSSIEFNAPSEYRKMSVSQRDNIQAAYSSMLPGVRKVDAYGSIAEHRREYCYYRTDHHWTGRGAYYAYTAFCNSAGFTPVPLTNMERKTKTNFLGSLYWLTRDSRLKESADTVEYFKIPGKYTTTVFPVGSKKGMRGTIYYEPKGRYGNYGVFLGGDWPLMKIERDAAQPRSGRNAILVKNSYGNPFATYLPSHFDKVFVIDYRYYEGSVLELIATEGITDLIFINGVFSANTSWHIKMIAKMMKGTGPRKSNSDTEKRVLHDSAIAPLRKDSAGVPEKKG